MRLANLDGTALFGAGSEWFWSMAQFVLVAVSLLGIYVQLRAQRGADLFEQSATWYRDWNEETFMVHRLAALRDLEERPVEAGVPPSASKVGDFFERLGYLIGRKHVRADDIWHTMRPQIGFWWQFLHPYLEVSRREWREPGALEWFEKLEQEMRRLDVKHYGPGVAPVLPMTIEEASADILRQLDVMDDARRGIYPGRRPELGGEVDPRQQAN